MTTAYSAYPGFINESFPPLTPTDINFSTVQAAVNDFIAEPLVIWAQFNSYVVQGSSYDPSEITSCTQIRPVLVGGVPETLTIYLPDVYGAWATANANYSITINYYYYLLASTRFPLTPTNQYIYDNLGNLTNPGGVDFMLLKIISGPVGITPPSPTTVTLQIKQNQNNTYTAQDTTVLTKYTQPVNKIRAKFGAGLTRIGVVEPTSMGGFLLYEEIASAPSGNVYVYDSNRHLVIVVDASQIAQYQA